MTMSSQNLEIKIMVVSMMLQDLLDETPGNTRFKHRLKFHANKVQKELEILNDVDMSNDAVSLVLTNAWDALETAIDETLKEKLND